MTAQSSPILPPPDRLAADLRGFGPLGIVAILLILAGNLVIVPLSALLVLVWAWRSGTPWHQIGYVRPKSWTRSLAIGVTSGVIFKLSMKAVVMPLLGAPPINEAYHYLVGNSAALPVTLFAVIVGAGFGEETVFRGYFFERLGKLFGSGSFATVSIVLLTSALFAIAHYHDQGVPGTEQALITGLVFASIFAVTGRIFTLMVAHATFDLTAVAIIYWDLESTVAHIFFK